MTTSDKAQFHAGDLFKGLIKDENLPRVVEGAAGDVQKIIRATWPKSIGDEPAKPTEKFATEAPKVFTLTNAKFEDGRPVTFININHPYAVAHQAKTGAVTKAAKAAGYNMMRSRKLQ